MVTFLLYWWHYHELQLPGKGKGTCMTQEIKGYIIDPDTSLIMPTMVRQHNLIQYRRLIKCNQLRPVKVFNNNRLWVDAEAEYGKTPFLVCAPSHNRLLVFGRSLILGVADGRCEPFKGKISDVAEYTHKVETVIGNGIYATVVVNPDADKFEFTEPATIH